MSPKSGRLRSISATVGYPLLMRRPAKTPLRQYNELDASLSRAGI